MLPAYFLANSYSYFNFQFKCCLWEGFSDLLVISNVPSKPVTPNDFVHPPVIINNYHLFLEFLVYMYVFPSILWSLQRQRLHSPSSVGSVPNGVCVQHVLTERMDTLTSYLESCYTLLAVLANFKLSHFRLVSYTVISLIFLKLYIVFPSTPKWSWLLKV